MKTEAIDFIRLLVIGKQLETDETRYTLEEGKLEGVYCDKMYFSDFTETKEGFSFHMTTVSNEKIYEMNSEGNPNILQKDFSGTSVYRYELAERKSTGEWTGFMHLISSTVKNHTMAAVVYGVFGLEFSGKELKWKERQLFYRDSPADDGKFRSVSFDADIRLYLEQKKLVFEYIPAYYDVNPKTMEKTLSKDKYPPYITKEK